jgi:hypothetical protein
MRLRADRHSVHNLACLIVTAILLLPATEASAQQDLVQFDDDSRMVGEIRGIERGRLSFNTGPTGTISIEWEDVSRLVSSRRFEILTQDGTRYFGSLAAPTTPGTLLIDADSGLREMPFLQVVELYEIESTLLDALDANVRFGYAYSKASDIKQLTFGWDMSHRRERRLVQASFNTSTSDGASLQSSRRSNLNTRFIRLQPNRWLWGGLGYFETNDELGIDLRSSAGAGKGRIVSQSNNNRILLLGGMVFTKESATVSVPGGDESTVEGLFYVDMEWFRFDAPELDVVTRFTFFPNLSDTGRFRTNLDVDFRWEMLSDLFLGFSLYHTHNSDPLTGGAKNDYGITTSLGWEF